MLALTRKSGYALIAMSYLSHPKGKIASAARIAGEFDLPVRLLMNVMKELSHSGLVSSVRGVNGGYVLSCDLRKKTLRELIRAMEGPIGLAQCFSLEKQKKKCSVVSKCPVRWPMHKVQGKLEDFLDNISLAEIVEENVDYEYK